MNAVSSPITRNASSVHQSTHQRSALDGATSKEDTRRQEQSSEAGSRTLEQRLKFDSGLRIGQSLVTFTLGKLSRKAIVNIGPRGKVSYLAEPDSGQMYSCWRTLRGDRCTADGAVLVWAAKNMPQLMEQFAAKPVAVVALHRFESAPVTGPFAVSAS